MKCNLIQNLHKTYSNSKCKECHFRFEKVWNEARGFRGSEIPFKCKQCHSRFNWKCNFGAQKRNEQRSPVQILNAKNAILGLKKFDMWLTALEDPQYLSNVNSAILDSIANKTLVHTNQMSRGQNESHSKKSPGSQQAYRSWPSWKETTSHIFMLDFWNFHWSIKLTRPYTFTDGCQLKKTKIV